MPGVEFVADTSAVILFQNGHPGAEDLFSKASRVYLPFTVRGELLFAAYNSKRAKTNLEHLEVFFAGCQSIQSDNHIEEEYAKTKLILRRKGRPIPENDIWIAACAKTRKLPLLCHDAHFDEIDDLQKIKL